MASPFFILEKEHTMNTQTTVNNQPSATNQDAEVGYYDCHTHSLCYINDVYERQEGRKSAIETWVNMSLVQGEKDDPSYVKCNVRVVGSDAALLMDQLKPFVNARNSNKRSIHKVMARVVLGDTFPLIITAKQGKNAGEVYPIIKGRLLKITWARVKTDDNVVFEHRSEKLPQDRAVANAASSPVASQAAVSDPVKTPPAPKFTAAVGSDAQRDTFDGFDGEFDPMQQQYDAQFDEAYQATGTEG
jgi:hypothetical protein